MKIMEHKNRPVRQSSLFHHDRLLFSRPDQSRIHATMKYNLTMRNIIFELYLLISFAEGTWSDDLAIEFLLLGISVQRIFSLPGIPAHT